MHNLITNAQLCDIVGSSNGFDQEHFSSKYLQSIVNSNPLLNVFCFFHVFSIYIPNVLYMCLKPEIPAR